MKFGCRQNKLGGGSKLNNHFVREGFSSYYAAKKETGHEFEEKIIMEQNCTCLLPYEMRRVDEESYYYFKTTGYLSLKEKLMNKKNSVGDYKNIYRKLIAAVAEVEEYLLPSENLLLESQNIFYDESEEKIYFCYIPGREKDLMQQLLDLTEDFLEIINYEDRELVEYLYLVHERILSGRLPDCEEKENENEIKMDVSEGEESSVQLDYDEEEEKLFFQERMEVKQSGKWYAEILTAIIINLMLMFLAGYELYSIYAFEWNSGKGKIIFVLLICIVGNTCYILRKSKLRASPEKYTTILTEEESIDKIGEK